MLRVWKGGFAPLTIAKETKLELDRLLPVLPKIATPEDYSNLIENLIHYWDDTSLDWRAVERRRKSPTEQMLVAELVKEKGRKMQREFRIRHGREYKLIGRLTNLQAESLVQSAQKVRDARSDLHALEHKILPKRLPDFGGWGYFAGLDALVSSEELKDFPEVYHVLYRTKSVSGGHIFVNILKDGSIFIDDQDKKKWIKELPTLKSKYAPLYSDLVVFNLNGEKLRHGVTIRIRVDRLKEFTWLPKKVLLRAGVTPDRTERFDLEGEILLRDVAEARLKMPGNSKSTASLVVFGEPGDKTGLGSSVLDGLGLRASYDKRGLERKPLHERT